MNPLLFALLEPARRAILARSAAARRLEGRDDPLAELPASTDSRYLARQVVLVGHGRVGRLIAQTLAAQGIPCVVADSNRERIEALRAQGQAAVCGDATEPATLVQAHIAQAQWLVIAVPDLVGVRAMVETARTLNTGIRVLVRCHNDDEATLLARELGVQVMLSEQALAQAMVQQVLQPAPG